MGRKARCSSLCEQTVQVARTIRLQALGESFDFEVRFKAEIPSAVSVTEPALSSELATALAGVGAKFQVESVEIHWQTENAAEKASSDTEFSPMPYAGMAAVVVLAVVVLLAVVGTWLACR